MSADSQYWVCVMDADGIRGLELYSARLDGSAPITRLSPALGEDFDVVEWFEVTPDGSTVVFAQGTNAAAEDPYTDLSLFTVPIAGGSVTEITPWVHDGELAFIWKPDLAPDGSRVAFFWYNESVGGLYSVNLDGTGLVAIDPSVDPWFLMDNSRKIDPRWEWTNLSPDSEWIYFYESPDLDVYTVPATGGTPIKITGDNPAGGDLDRSWFTPDSSRLVYLADFDTLDVDELYSAPIGGGTATKLNRELEPGEQVVDLVVFLPDSSGVIYGVSDDGYSSTWYLVAPDGGTSTEIGNGIEYVLVTADSSTMITAIPEVTAYPLGGGDPVQLGGLVRQRCRPIPPSCGSGRTPANTHSCTRFLSRGAISSFDRVL